MTAATGDVKVTIDNRARSCSGQNTRIGAAESGVVLWIARREGGQDSSDDLQIGRRSREFLREQPDAARSSPPARWLSVIRPMLPGRSCCGYWEEVHSGDEFPVSGRLAGSTRLVSSPHPP